MSHRLVLLLICYLALGPSPSLRGFLRRFCLSGAAMQQVTLFVRTEWLNSNGDIAILFLLQIK